MVDFAAKLQEKQQSAFQVDWQSAVQAQREHAQRHLTDARVAFAFNEIDHSAVLKSLDGVQLALDSIGHAAREYVKQQSGLLVPASPGLVIEDVPAELSFESLTRGQRRAFARIERWTKNRTSRYFVLRGHPGTGKTYLMRYLLRNIRGINWIFTAPTNKATKELAKSLGEDAKTTFSALGLRMSHDEDELVMSYGKTRPYFPKNTILVVDEASMVNRKLMKFIDQVCKQYDLLVLYVGDPNQLPPVGEKRSGVWSLVPREFRASLREVKRYDNEILALSIRIRHAIRDKQWISPLRQDVGKDGTGVHLLGDRRDFVKAIRKLKRPDDFLDQKVVAWTNRTVDRYTDIIRENFDFLERFEVGERIMMARPFSEDDQILAHIDDEFEVRHVSTGVARADGEQVDVIQLQVASDEQDLLLKVPVDPIAFKYIMNGMATKARRAKGAERKVLWDQFWDTDNRFHHARYGYAMTSHRIQGSTQRTTFVDQQDILRNENEEEAFRSLMVACTRPTTDLISF